VVIQTTRFGQVQIQADDVLSFPEGILGFQDLKKFVMLDDPTDEIFAWLQSCDQAAIAFPVLEPELFSETYKPTLAKADLENLKLAASDKNRMFCIITIPEDPTLMTANMKAPIVVNVPARIARQCVLQDNSLAIREPIFLKLQQRVVAAPQTSIKAKTEGIGVRIGEGNAATAGEARKLEAGL
jgi:flagellar assembly factor FliW